jgi:diaminopropionate ammonia-lyase
LILIGTIMTQDWIARNPRARRDRAYGPEQRGVIDPAGVTELLSDLAACPAHKPTPLHALPARAAELGIGALRVKDESQRFGFGAFKALGGVHAVGMALVRAVEARTGRRPNLEAVMQGAHRDVTAGFTFATASSGNHGRAVAAGARLFGNRCVIFLPAFATAEKEAAIRARGAEVIRVDGDYEAAVEQCRRQAETNGWTIISDTSWDGYADAPRDVMRGYTVLAEEVLQQWPEGPTHVFVQAGVGGLAAAVIGYFWARSAARPQFIVVEPASADCWLQSNRAGRPALASGDADTVMGGLACREISPITWPVVGLGADWFMTITEAEVLPARQALAHPHAGDPAIASGPSGCAGFAGLLRVSRAPAVAAAMGLGRDSRVLVINSEGPQ